MHWLITTEGVQKLQKLQDSLKLSFGIGISLNALCYSHERKLQI